MKYIKHYKKLDTVKRMKKGGSAGGMQAVDQVNSMLSGTGVGGLNLGQLANMGLNLVPESDKRRLIDKTKSSGQIAMQDMGRNLATQAASAVFGPVGEIGAKAVFMAQDKAEELSQDCLEDPETGEVVCKDKTGIIGKASEAFANSSPDKIVSNLMSGNFDKLPIANMFIDSGKREYKNLQDKINQRKQNRQLDQQLRGTPEQLAERQRRLAYDQQQGFGEDRNVIYALYGGKLDYFKQGGKVYNKQLNQGLAKKMLFNLEKDAKDVKNHTLDGWDIKKGSKPKQNNKTSTAGYLEPLTDEENTKQVGKNLFIKSKYKSGGSTVNSSGNYTKPGLRKRLFNKIKAGTKGGNPGQWSARKAQLLAKEYKKAGGGYKN